MESGERRKYNKKAAFCSPAVCFLLSTFSRLFRSV
jgi:hypothetical protein